TLRAIEQQSCPIVLALSNVTLQQLNGFVYLFSGALIDRYDMLYSLMGHRDDVLLPALRAAAVTTEESERICVLSYDDVRVNHTADRFNIQKAELGEEFGKD